jgi:hypothetical protein
LIRKQSTYIMDEHKENQIPDSKFIIIGDLHGNIKELKSLMENLKPYLEEYNLVFLGDYVDR